VTLHNASLVLIYILSAMENKFFFIFSGQRKPLNFFLRDYVLREV